MDDAEVTSRIAARVRRLRRQAGLTRRALAGASGISERYLAQLETAGANVSIAVLCRLAGALDVGLHALVPDGGEPVASARSQPAIALIGLRGAGKTTLGRWVAERHHVSYIPLSERIASSVGMAVGELLELGGIAAFRRAEKEALRELCRVDRAMVVETSGGLVEAEDTFDLLLSRFVTVWIKASPQEHMARVINQNDLRPMAGRERAMDELEALLEQRSKLYARADHVIDTCGRDITACGHELAVILHQARTCDARRPLPKARVSA